MPTINEVEQVSVMRHVLWPWAAIFCAAIVLASGPSGAESPPPFRDFTFKRVKPPPPGATKRITVQIAPKPAEPVSPVSVAPAKPDKPSTLAAAWYWDAISPLLADAGPGRLPQAVRELGNAPAGQAIRVPRLQHLQSIAARHGTDILTATIGTEVSPALVLAVISVESSGRTDAISSAGAAGLMQLMPATAERFGVSDRSDPIQNIRGGVAFLDWLMREFDRDPIMVLAGYNAGENAVKSHGGVPPYNETRLYVPKVLAAWNVARGLCVTPPQLVSDGCVFAVRTAERGG